MIKIAILTLKLNNLKINIQFFSKNKMDYLFYKVTEK